MARPAGRAGVSGPSATLRWIADARFRIANEPDQAKPHSPERGELVHEKGNEMKLRMMMKLMVLEGVLLGLAPAANAFYNPSQGRWLNRDPIEETGCLNLYTICINDTVAQIDVLGRAKWGDSSPGETENLDDCLNACDKICFRFGPFNNFTSCYCYCWNKFPPTRRGKAQAALIAEYLRLQPGTTWPTCPDGKPAQAHHVTPLADGGADGGSNIVPMCADDHTKYHKDQGDFNRWGKRKGRTCKKSDPLDQE